MRVRDPWADPADRRRQGSNSPWGDAYVVPKAAVYSVIAARPTELIVIRLAGDFGEAPEFQADVADPGLDRDSPKP